MRKLLVFIILSVQMLYIGKTQDNNAIMDSIYAMSIEELMNTKVSIATKSEQSVNESPAIVSVITSQDIKNMGAREFEDVLQTVPGFELMKRFAGYYGVGVRGIKDPRTNSKILILIDGIPYNQIFYGNSILSGGDINLEAIEKIEILRGPGSALYGRNAFSAVINIITKTAKTNTNSYVKAKIGQFNTKALSGYYGYHKNKLSITFSGTGQYTDGSDAKFPDGFGNDLLWNIKHKNLTLNTKIDYGKFTFTSQFMKLNDGGLLNDNLRDVTSGTYNLNYKTDINPRLSISAKIYGYNQFNTENIEDTKPGIKDSLPIFARDANFKTYADAYPLGIYYSPSFKEYNYGTELELNYKLSQTNQLLFGIQADKHGVYDVILETNVGGVRTTPPLPKIISLPVTIPGVGKDNLVVFPYGWFVNGEHKYSNIAFYLQDQWTVFNRLNLTIGGRFDYDSEIGSVINPRIGMVYNIAKNLYFKSLYGRAYRAPSPSEQFQTFGYAFGNKDLKIETIDAFEFSVSHKTDHISHSLSYFKNYATNLIFAAQIASVNPNNVYYNLGKNNSSGFEYEAKFVLVRNLYIFTNASYTWSKNTQNLNGIDSSFNHQDISPFKLNLGFNYNFLKYLNLNVNGYYRSTMEKLYVESPFNSDLYPIQDKVGDFMVLNTSLQIQLMKNFQFAISGYNILNETYYSQDSGHLNTPKQPSRQVCVSATWQFN